MAPPVLHFRESELAARRGRAVQAMRAGGLDGLLLFKQESRYYLSGYDTGAHTYFHCLYLGADGRMGLLCRLPDVRQARFTSVIEDVRYWSDGPEARPGEDLRALLEDYGCAGRRLGVETDCCGMTAQVWRHLATACQGFCHLEAAVHLIDRLRLVKSAAELEIVGRAAGLAYQALARGRELARPGAYEGDILAAMQGAVYQGGGQTSATEWAIGSGDGALLAYHTGRRHLAERDRLQLCLSGVYLRYHASLAASIFVGPAEPRLQRLFDTCQEALAEITAACRPGAALGDLVAAYRGVADGAGLDGAALTTCGHGLGATYAPAAADWPTIVMGSSLLIEAGMVLYLEAALVDGESRSAMALGESVEVTSSGCRPLVPATA